MKTSSRSTPEELHTCERCHRPGFTASGIKHHRCKVARLPARAVLRKTATLTPHPMLERITMMGDVVTALQKQKVKKPEHKEAADDMNQDIAAFCNTLDAEGIIDPLKVTKEGLIADGRNRWSWAVMRKVDHIPCQIVSDDEARRIIETMLIGRRQMTKAMRAYAAVLLHPEVVESGKPGPKRRDNSPTECANTHSASNENLSRKELAHKFGVGETLIDQACKLYEAFEHSKTLREKHEKLVWAGFGLGGIIAGLAGDRTDQSITQMDFFSGLFRRFNAFGGSLLESWSKTETDEQKELVADALGNFLARIPQDLREQAAQRMTHFTTDQS